MDSYIKKQISKNIDLPENLEKIIEHLDDNLEVDTIAFVYILKLFEDNDEYLKKIIDSVEHKEKYIILLQSSGEKKLLELYQKYKDVDIKIDFPFNNFPNFPSADDVVEKLCLLLKLSKNYKQIKKRIKEHPKNYVYSVYYILNFKNKIDICRTLGFKVEDYDESELIKNEGYVNGELKCKYGCRMYKCECIDNQKICPCGITPEKRFRIPKEFGGWKGCYCSLECLEKEQEITELEKIKINILNSYIKNGDSSNNNFFF